MRCGLCKNTINDGAHVCSSCHARIYYGTPPGVKKSLYVVSLVVAFVLYTVFAICGWGTGFNTFMFAAILGGVFWLFFTKVTSNKYKDHVQFIK